MTKDAATIDNPYVAPENRLQALSNLLARDRPGDPTPESTIDLHLHTNYSDGFWTPSGLVLAAVEKGLQVIGLTDHDCFDGLPETFSAVDIARKEFGVDLRLVPGVELSTNYFYGPDRIRKEIHILVYYPAETFGQFSGYLRRLDNRNKAYLGAFQRNRTLRIYEMISRFNDVLPVEIPALARLKAIQDPIITDSTVERGLRGSVAPGRLLTSTGIFDVHRLSQLGKLHEIEDEEFTQDYLEALADVCGSFSSAGDFMKAFFDKAKPSAKTGYIGLTESPEWAVQVIGQQTGGIPVLAHPAKYPFLMEELLELLVPLGLRGVELLSDHAEPEVTATALDLVSSQYPELVVTIGSDCHGHNVESDVDYTPSNKLGLKCDLGVHLGSYYDRILDLLGL